MKNKLSSREILVNEIVFHRADVIHLYGFISREGQYVPTRFVCSLSLLSHLLSQNGREGQEIISQIRQLLSQPHAAPLTLDMIDRFGTTLPLEAFSIQMQMPLGEKAGGALMPQPAELVFIERIIPFPAA